MYGPDADELFAAVHPLLAAATCVRNALATLRYSPPADDVRRVEVPIEANKSIDTDVPSAGFGGLLAAGQLQRLEPTSRNNNEASDHHRNPQRPCVAGLHKIRSKPQRACNLPGGGRN
jgi:hypothetical protein